VNRAGTLDPVATAPGTDTRVNQEKPDMSEPQQMRFSYLRKSAFIGGCLLFLSFTAATTFAQHGGKAEPLRIDFVTGKGTATERGTVRNSEQYEYTVTARKGQRMTIKITSTPAKSSVFQLLGEGQDTLGLEHDANFDVSIVLPKDGDYFISVSRPTSTKGKSRFNLTIALK